MSVMAVLLAAGMVTVATPSYAATPEQAQILSDTNKARASSGLPALIANPQLDAVATAWAKQLEKNGTLSHNPNFSSQYPAGWTMAGENVAQGFPASSVVAGWMNSPGHRANILNSYTEIGIGFVEAGGKRFAVQNFGTYKNSSKALSSAQPTVTGTAALGNTLTARANQWAPTPVTLSYQWKRDGVAISGVGATTYKIASADIGKKITVTVSGKKTGYTTQSRTSPATTAVTAKYFAAKAPVVTGTVQAGKTLTAAVGNWVPSPDTYKYVWKRSGVVISGATAKSYLLTGSDVGKKLTVTVSGTRSGYKQLTLTSAASVAVRSR